MDAYSGKAGGLRDSHIGRIVRIDVGDDRTACGKLLAFTHSAHYNQRTLRADAAVEIVLDFGTLRVEPRTVVTLLERTAARDQWSPQERHRLDDYLSGNTRLI